MDLKIWGDYNLGPIKLKTGHQNGVFVWIRSTSLNENMEEKIIKYLGKNIKCILIDPFRGFSLSHEKWFLPPFHLRHNFYYMYIPNHILEAHKHQYVYMYSSDNKGYLFVN